jgi:DNA-binding NtrC family response regulator
MPEKKSIIIVDDDKSILRVFTRVLERKGYAVTTAETGKDALKQFKQHNFDAALIDVRLPDVNGTDLLPEIKSLSPKTVKIVFTGSPDFDGLVSNGNKNMDAFLIKPVNPELLLSILDQKLEATKVA